MKKISVIGLTQLIVQAAHNPRRRQNLNMHASPNDGVQRFLNVFQPGTYVRPHRHADKWELFVALEGAAVVLTFDDRAGVLERVELNRQATRVVEIPAGVWHTVVSLAAGTALFEVKPGPYDPSQPAEYAPWSPAEHDPHAAVFIERLVVAQVGDLVVGD